MGAALLTVGVTACDAPVVDWADDAPVATVNPSPLAHPPFVPVDSAQRDGTPDAAYLAAADVMREAGAASLLSRVLDTTAWSRLRPASDSASALSSASANAGASMTPAGNGMMEMPGMDMSGVSATGSAMTHANTGLGDGESPLDSLRCARSLRVVDANARGRVAVWWTRRSNGRVALVAAWHDSAGNSAAAGAAPVTKQSTWRGPIVIDSLDQGPGDARASERGAAGCARPAPSVAIDDAMGYVHVAYVVAGPEGAGVFYAHQMDPRAAFEPPQVIVYGDRLGSARVAASGTIVAVAYEDPNSGERTRVGLAVSRSSGHLFEPRLIASGTTSIARDPYVNVRGQAVIVGWSELPGGEPKFTTRRAKVH